MAAAITTTSTLTKPVNVIFQQTLLRTARALCPYFAGSVPGEVQQHAGSFTASWRRIENLTPTTSALAELTGNESFPTRDSITPSITGITAAVSKYGQYILLSEEVDLVNFSGQSDDLSMKLGMSAGRSLNMLQRNELEDNATLVRVGAVASDGLVNSKITVSAIAKVINDLARNNAMVFMPESDGSTNIGTQPILPGYYGACHPDVAYDITTLTGFVSVEKYAGQVATMNGEFGMISTAGYGVRFVQTSDASINTNTGAATGTGLRGATKNDLYYVPIWGMDAVGSLGFGFQHVKESYTAGDKLPGIQVINKDRGSSGVADPLDELSTLGWKSWHAAKILNSTFIETIRCCATKLS
jgi:N4-gp56 family major capsid protein